MDYCFEVVSSEDSNEDNRSIGEAEETALYSLVHHSEDTYETGMLDLSENYINQRNKAFRLDSVKQITHFTNPANHISVPVDNSDVNYMSLNGNIASTSGYRPGKARSKNGHWVRDPWDERHDRPWGVQNRIRNLYSNSRNLVPVHVENSQITFKRPENTFEQTKVEYHNTFPNLGHRNNFREVLYQNTNSYQRYTNNNVAREKLTDTVVAKTLNKCASGSAINYTSRFTNNESSNVRSLDTYSNKSSKISLRKDISHEVLTISDSDEGNHASESESIVEVSVPPKPKPPIVALDSSDESDSVVISTSLPILNVLEITNEASKEQSNHEKSVHTTSEICDTSQNPTSGSLKELKRNKKKKKKKKLEKHSKSIECIRWTTGMIKFYNRSWGGETYDHLKLQQEMTNNPTKWKILDIDKIGPLRNFGPLARVRCGNCHQFGHMAKQCPDPKKVKCCSMCGQQGHRENQCDNKICFKCGRAAPAYNEGCPACWQRDHPKCCSACGARDHYNWLCPDVWRKFHSTITMEDIGSNELQAPQYKIDSELSCCYCAGQGHTAAMCPYLFKQSGSYNQSSNTSFNIFTTMNIMTSRKRKKRNSYFDGKNKHDFNRKRRKTN